MGLITHALGDGECGSRVEAARKQHNGLLIARLVHRSAHGEHDAFAVGRDARAFGGLWRGELALVSPIG
jgi:hypothetical protein